MEFIVEQKKIDLDINTEEKVLEVNITNEPKEVKLDFSNYDDRKIKQDIGDLTTQVSTNTNDISQNKADISTLNNKVDNIHVPAKTSELTNDSGFIDETYHDNTKADKTEIPDVSGFITKDVNNLTYYTLKTNTGSLIDLEINQSNYVVTLSLKDVDGNVISSDTIDLPLESVVVSGIYDNTNKKIVLTLQNGNTIDIPVGDLIAGLQTEITSQNKLASDLVDDTNSGNKFVTISEKNNWNAKADASSIPTQLSQLTDDATHRVVTDTEKTIWNAKADEGFTGIIDGTSANPTDGAALLNGVYKADESKTTSYISLPMEDGTTKRQSIQKGGIVIRTAARLIVLATQNLMYQYDVALQCFYPAEPFVESVLRREFVDGIAELGTVSPPNTYYLTLPISYLAATINTGDAGHTRITFTVADEIAEGDFELYLTDTEGNELIYADGATPKPVTGETWIFEIYGNTCEPICFKTTDGKSREDLLKIFMRRNSDQIYYPSIDGKPNISIMTAKGYEQDRKVGLTAESITFTNFENWTYYGIPNYVPLDLSLYNTSTHANMLQPYTQLPDGDYWVKNPGKIWLGNESYELIGKEYIHKKGTVLTVWGGEYACAYYAWNATDEVYEGGFFITYQDLLDYISEQGFEKGYTITRQTTATGSIVMNDGRHYKRVRETGVTSLTFSLVNSLGEVPDTFKARVTLRTATTFTTFNVTQRDAYKLYFMGDDCANGVITGVANKYYDIEFKADGFGDVVGIVHSYDEPPSE